MFQWNSVFAHTVDNSQHNIRLLYLIRYADSEVNTYPFLLLESSIFLVIYKLKIFVYVLFYTYTVWQLYNATDFILTKIEVPSMMQCMPLMYPNFICNLAKPQHLTLSMTGNTAPCCAGSERTWSQWRHRAKNEH